MAEEGDSPRIPEREPREKRTYTVLREMPNEGNPGGAPYIVVVGDYEGKDPDDACWEAVEAEFKSQAEAAGEGQGDGPRLAGVLAERLSFEEYALEPVRETRRVKRR